MKKLRRLVPILLISILIVQPITVGGKQPARVTKKYTTTKLATYPVDKADMLDYSTFFGGSDIENVVDSTVDSQGNVIIIGSTHSTDFPTFHAKNESKIGGSSDLFLAKFSRTNELLFSTYLGGSGNEFAEVITIDPTGNYIITGRTGSSDFPVKNAFNSTKGLGIEAFVMKLDTNFDIIWSTFLGGNDYDTISSVQFDIDGNIVLGGYSSSSNYPTKNAYQTSLNGGYDMVFTRFSPSGQLLWSTYLGGSQSDFLQSMDINSDNEIIFAGTTRSSDIPIVNAYAPNLSNPLDFYLGNFGSDGIIKWSTYFGGTGYEDEISIKVAGDDQILTAFNTPSADIPTRVFDPIDTSFRHTLGIAKWRADGYLVWSKTYSGTNHSYVMTDFIEDSASHYFVLNRGVGGTYPRYHSYNHSAQSTDTLITEFDSDGNILWSNIFGGKSIDAAESISISDGRIAVTGETLSSQFPTTSDAYSRMLSSSQDIFFSTINIPNVDADHDGMNNWDEWRTQLNYLNPDTDGDSMYDGLELQYGLNPLDPSDRATDLDSDHLPNYWEVKYNLDPTNQSDANLDLDYDGLNNLQEYQQGTNPLDSDSDFDGLLDGKEIAIFMTDPINNDTDSDKLTDGAEIYTYHTNPLSNDTDSDGISDYVEIMNGTNPRNSSLLSRTDVSDAVDQANASGSFLPFPAWMAIISLMVMIPIQRKLRSS